MTKSLYDPEDYDFQYLNYHRDIPFWLHIADNYYGSQSILEFACGTGRVTFELASEGYQVHGVDISSQMLSKARSKALHNGHVKRVHLATGDMRTYISGIKHQLCIVTFTSFLHLIGIEAQQKALSNFSNNLAEGGYLLVDIINPNPRKLDQEYELRYEVVDKHRRQRLLRWHKSTYDDTSQTSLWEFHCKIFKLEHPFEIIREFSVQETVSIIYPEVWRDMLAQTGFDVVEQWGDFYLNPFREDSSPRMLFLCRKT